MTWHPNDATRWRPLCVGCASAILMSPAVRVEFRSSDTRVNPDSLHLGLLEEARAAVDDGARVIIDNETDCGVYADTLYRGSAVCARHLPLAIMDYRHNVKRW